MIYLLSFYVYIYVYVYMFSFALLIAPRFVQLREEGSLSCAAWCSSFRPGCPLRRSRSPGPKSSARRWRAAAGAGGWLRSTWAMASAKSSSHLGAAGPKPGASETPGQSLNLGSEGHEMAPAAVMASHSATGRAPKMARLHSADQWRIAGQLEAPEKHLAKLLQSF